MEFCGCLGRLGDILACFCPPCLMQLHLLIQTLWFRSSSCWESRMSLMPPCRDSLGRFTFFGEFCWFWWQHCCQAWLLLLCSIVG